MNNEPLKEGSFFLFVRKKIKKDKKVLAKGKEKVYYKRAVEKQREKELTKKRKQKK